MNHILRIMRKEFAGFFSSPVAFIFFAAFLAVTLFVFFWVDTFFARNIADVRPLFEWMPVLLIFLVSAITMRVWSEERRSGTLELLLTAPVNPLQLVLGKFIACLALVAIALLLTIPLPISVSLIGNIDWGPVFGGYLAALFLAAAYIAIGLYVSARSENQIISLIITALVCTIFYLIGSNTITSFFAHDYAGLLKLIGSGSRFESITRGVVDVRDLYYYLSLVGVFLALNVFALERQRWAGNKRNSVHRRWGLLTLLLAANFLMANILLQPVNVLRADITEGRLYSISNATKGYLAQLKEPLLIRGYFSSQTHPLLAPLVPQLRDLLVEYAVAGGERIQVEFIDPLENPELEQEAGEKYGIKPVAFQTASKYQAAVVNSYFDILIKYGDQYEVLGFRDLIDVKARSEMDIDIELRDAEYDITSAIKKVLYSYQGAGNVFENIPQAVTFKAYLSPDNKLPAPLKTLRNDLQAALTALEQSSAGKLTYTIEDPAANGGTLAAQLENEYGFRPMTAGLFDPNRFWFYMLLESSGQVVQVPLPEDLSTAGLQRGIDAALKRFSSGFLKTIALVLPEQEQAQGFMRQPTGKQFSWVQDALEEEHNVTLTDLKNGLVGHDTDLLIVLAPHALNEKQVFAIDQFLMQGGTVIMSTAQFDIQGQGVLTAQPNDSGLDDWLQYHGLSVEKTMVLDPQNAKFPIPTRRNLGGFTVQEMHVVEYPYFIDVREDGLERASGLNAGLDQLTVNWASPIQLDVEKNNQRHVIRLLQSSAQAWTSDSQDIQPDFRAHSELGFVPATERGQHLLGVVVEGQFESWFKGKESPLLKQQPEADAVAEAPPADKAVINRVIERSPDSARIILMASNYFLTDEALGLASNTLGTQYTNPIQLLANAVDWSLEERGLLSIRGRSHFSRTLANLDNEQQMFWEYLNYGLAVVGLIVVWLVVQYSRKRVHARFAALLEGRG